MAKKLQLTKSPILHNVALLYFLFIVTLLHLGYFIFTKESLLLACFSLAVVFVYLANPNMVVVLGVSLVFVDLLYGVKYGFDASGNKWREGFDSSGIDVSGVDVSGVDVSGSDTFPNRRIGFETEKKTEKVDIANTLETMFNQIREIQEKKDEDPKNAVNPMVGAKGVLQENISGNSIEEVQKSSSDVKSMINTVKEMSPEVKDSLKSIHTVDINEINKLMNNLSEVAASFKNNGA